MSSLTGDMGIGKPGSVFAENIKNPAQEKQAGFADVMKETIAKVDGLEKQADASVVDMLNGNTSVHETMISLQKADVSMRLLLTVRNKAIGAYREISRMQF